MTRKDKDTLLKVGVGAAAIAWAAPQILGMLFVLTFLGLFATVAVFALAGTLLKYALIAGCAMLGVAVLARLIGGPAKKTASELPVERALQRKKRLEKAKLDLELAKAVAAKTAPRAGA